MEEERQSSSKQPLVSIIIDNYNYGKYISRSIESALSQTYPHREVIVVDDGSTDNSREIIDRYKHEVIPIFKENGGQSSTFNRGFERSSGEALFFLDADDTFYSHKVEKVMNLYNQILPLEKKILLYHCLDHVNLKGEKIRVRPKGLRTLEGKVKKNTLLQISSSEEAINHSRRFKFPPFLVASTSGLSITRELAQKIFPLPEDIRLWGDNYLARSSMLFGSVYGTSQVLGSYLIHEENFAHKTKSLSNRAQREDPVFIKSLQNYLNQKLQSHQIPLTLSFYDSMYSKYFYKSTGSARDMLRLAFQVPLQHFCWRTFVFSLEAFWMALKLGVGKFFKKRKDLTH